MDPAVTVGISIATILLSWVGAYVLACLKIRSEKDKTNRDDAIHALELLTVKCCKYWKKYEQQDELAEEIITEFHLLGKRLPLVKTS